MLFAETAGAEMAELRREIRDRQVALSLVRRGSFLPRWRAANPGVGMPRVVADLLGGNRRARRRLRSVMTAARK